MQPRCLLVCSLVVLFVFSLFSLAIAQEKATPAEIVTSVHNAASSLAKSGEPGLADFNKKVGQWVWKDTYIFVLDCSKGIMAAHPMKPELVGKDILAMKDTQGKAFFSELCGAARNPAGVWVEYLWPKPGETASARKVSFAYPVNGTPYVVAAGIYDDKISMTELVKVSTK